MGVERKSVAMSEHERITCAYHEAGHAVVAALLPDADPLHKVTIIPRGRALGVTMQLPEADRYTHSKPFIEAQIAILMGGRVAEELFLRQMTSGASNDIERATELARKMVCELGMSPLGPMHFRGRRAAGTTTAAPPASARTRRAASTTRFAALVMRGYETARQIIERQRNAVKALAEELLEVESVDADRLKQILAAAVVPAGPYSRPCRGPPTGTVRPVRTTGPALHCHTGVGRAFHGPPRCFQRPASPASRHRRRGVGGVRQA